MGHYSHTCKLSNVPITGGTPVALIVIKLRKNLFDNSEDSLRKYGSTYMCSNDAARLKYSPTWFPIRGKYDDYGGIEAIVEDEHTKVLEDYYGLPIQEIMNVITSGRKDDGYDGNLNVIKEKVVYPEDWVKGESHFVYYQKKQNDPQPPHWDVSGIHNKEWLEEGYEGWTVWKGGKKCKATKEEYEAAVKLTHEQYQRYKDWVKDGNPDPDDDYKNPQYLERYKELLTYSGMWIHGDVYDKLTENPRMDEYDKLDMGTHEVLTSLGFVKGEEDKTLERFNVPYTKGKLTVHSDGTWIGGKHSGTYTVTNFRTLAEEVGETIDFSPIEREKDRAEQIFDLQVPSTELIEKCAPKEEKVTKEELQADYNEIKEGKLKDIFGKMSFKAYVSLRTSNIISMTRQEQSLAYHFLNPDFSDYKITNPLTIPYIKAAKEGKLKDNMVRFWRFEHYMFACGRFYDVVGTSPQDGEHKDVMKVLQTAVEVLQPIITEYDAENAEYEE